MDNENTGLKRDDETMDKLFHGFLKVLQKEKGYRFSVDSPLLAYFVTLRKGDRVVDLGTGSGVIAMILALRFAEVSIAEVEIQQELADIAGRNIELNGLGDRIRMYPGDVKEIKGNARFVELPMNVVKKEVIMTEITILFSGNAGLLFTSLVCFSIRKSKSPQQLPQHRGDSAIFTNRHLNPISCN